MSTSPFAGELEANRITVKRLLDLAQHGDLRIPPFQRPLRWRRADHLLLLDSLYRGFPIGTLLLWKHAAEAGRVIFGEIAIDAGAEADALWVVDGQQRITSIVGCFHRADSALGRRMSEFAFCFDLEEERFLPAGGALVGDRYVPVNRLRAPSATARWAREVGASEARHDKAQRVCERLLGYEVPAYITSARSDEVLRTIFARSNTAGKRMRDNEVFEALNRGMSPSSTPTGLIERLAAAVEGLNFGAVEGDHLRRALVGVSGHNPKDALPAALEAPGAASRFEGETVEGLRRSILFLREEAGIPHVQMLPYALPIILLPGFFHRFPEPGERTLELLVRWVWRGIAGQTHMATNQQFNPHFKALNAGDEEAVAVAWLTLAARTRPAILPESEVFNLRGMRTRLELAALFTLGPKSLLDEHELSPVEIFEPDVEGEQRSLLLEGGAGEGSGKAADGPDLPRLPLRDSPLRKSVGARLLHPAIVGGERAVAGALARAGAEVLRGHGVDDDLHDAVRSSRWVDVAKGRGARIRQLVERLITRHARWGEDDDGPSIEATLRGEDGDDMEAVA